MRLFLSGLMFAGLLFAATNPASATVTASCTDFTGVNGTTNFPGTFVGTVGNGVGQVCQIGNVSGNNVSGTGTYVNNSQPTSIYSFYWDGGSLAIQEKLGNNGIGDAVDVYLDALAGPTSTSPSSTVASIQIPFTSGPSSSYTLFSAALSAGYYAIENTLAPQVDDPTFQINFTGSTSTPEPASLAVLLGGLASATLLRRRQNARA